MSYRILVTDGFGRDFSESLSKYGEVINLEFINEECERDIDILIVRSRTKVDRNLIDRMKSLKMVITATHGADHINAEYLLEKGIEFYNAPVQSYDVAQGVIAYILAFATNLVKSDRQMKRGFWGKKGLKGTRIKEKTLGIIGFGNIGREVADLATKIGMKVIAYDPYVKNDNPILVNLKDLLHNSDFITIHVPLTEETKDMLGKDEFASMKKGAFLICTARGGIIDEEVLLQALDEEVLGGAAFDVFEHQPPFNDDISNRIVRHNNIISTPHSIAQTFEALKDKERRVIEIVKDYVKRSIN